MKMCTLFLDKETQHFEDVKLINEVNLGRIDRVQENH